MIDSSTCTIILFHLTVVIIRDLLFVIKINYSAKLINCVVQLQYLNPEGQPWYRNITICLPLRGQPHRSAGFVCRIKYSTLSRSGLITSVSCTEYSALIAHNIQFVRVYNVRTTVCLKWMLQENFYWAVITFHDKKKNPVHRATILVSKFVICTLLLVMDITKILLT